MQNKFLVGLGLPLALSGFLLSGCNNAATETPGAQTQPVSQTTGVAPASNTAKDAEKSGEEHHAGTAGAMKTLSHTTKLAFSSEPKVISVGKPSTWTLQITDAKSGTPVNDFEVEMTKQMHLIVVKNDLSWFNHLHPKFQGGGKFTVTTQVPTAGTYKIYADYTLKGVGKEVPQYEFATAGETVTPAKVSIAPDKMRGMWLQNTFNAHPESEPDAKGGATYQVALMPMPMPIVAGRDIMLHFQVRNAKGVPITDLQPYLGAMGHCVILSSDTNSYLHSHPMSGGMEGMEGMDHSMGEMKMDSPAPKSGGPDVIFHTNFPKAGLYKVWGQFQHKGKVITANFVVNAAPGAAKISDEAAPHSH